jgi:hypothetical protein
MERFENKEYEVEGLVLWSMGDDREELPVAGWAVYLPLRQIKINVGINVKNQIDKFNGLI